jgi:hypothetical protein
MSDAHGGARITLGALTLRHVDPASVRFGRNQRKLSLGDDGNFATVYHTIMREAPRLEFATGDIGALLTLLSHLDAPMWVHSTVGAVALLPRGNDAGPGWRAGSTHVQYALALGQTWLDALEWTTGAAAIARCTSFGLSSTGAADPVARSLVAAPTVDAAQTAWVLDTLTIGGTPVAPSRFSLTIGHNATNEDDSCYDSGKPWPKMVQAAGAMAPLLVSGSIDARDLSTTVSDGSIVATFKPKAANAPALGSGTVALTINAAMVERDTVAGGRPSTRTIDFLGRHDGTNRALTVAVS